MKKTKKFLLLNSTILLPIPLLLSCNESKSNEKASEIFEDKEKSDTKKLSEIIEKITIKDDSWKFSNSFGIPVPKSETYFTELNLATSKMEYQLEGENSDKIDSKIIALIPEREKENNLNVSNLHGKGTFTLEFWLKDNPQVKITKNYLVEGFNHNPFNTDSSGSIPIENVQELQENTLEKYIKANQLQRFESDNKDYVETLKRQFTFDKPFDINDIRTELKISEEEKKKYDELAKEAKIDSYDDAKLKGFTLPTYKEGKVEGLLLNDRPEVVKGPSWVDAVGRDQWQIKGVPRYLVNQKWKDAALQTFQVLFTNTLSEEEKTSTSTSGTMWIMDFEKPENGKYPTKWYFGTNVHVAEAITNKTRSFSIARLNKDAGIRTKFKVVGFDENFTRFTFQNNLGDPMIKTIYSGKDYLNSKPSDFLATEQKEKFKDNEEFVDFAVIEIDFSKPAKESISADVAKSSKHYEWADKFKTENREDLVKLITNDYATETDKHIKFLKTSYLKNYSQIDRPLNKNETYNGDDLYIVGYPASKSDYLLDMYADADQIEAGKYGMEFSLWTNADRKFYDAIKVDPVTNNFINFSEKEINQGNYLSYQIGYRTYTDKPGVTDEFYAVHRLGKDLHTAPDGTKFIASGLAYLPKHYAPGGGASGSSVRNQNNELVAVYHAANSTARTGLAVAFRSEGYDYKGALGTYNLPQYDLIYGGGKDQKTSYRQALLSQYQSNSSFKTNLFPNGVNEIPEEFKFTNETQKEQNGNSTPSAS
ncbi:Ig-specific serine endopeptidase MIP [Mesomycoplasma lagogenitalium]|uniref:DUF31 domain-containing protein n=1 Tax=Mesomycoplasma lagogenitalium TaxID=171286 RepID=A0ABY8LUS4_9BACT|nr:hypothetical protein [Mesomycoplasma lagogenitalium]WGI37000.1 hypothetical protein QEG99_01800 [Mesomycoplasma lagogenitalium]